MNNIELWPWLDLEQTSSTNDTAKEQSAQSGQPCVVTAKVQTNGRGRRGHNWVSESGNLFMSFAFHETVNHPGHLAIMSAVAVWQTLRHFCPQADLKIKWPNDVLADNAKISGILFERGHDDFWIMGIGINIVSHPELLQTGYNTVSLHSLGANTDRISVLKTFTKKWDELSALYHKHGFSPIRQTWLDNCCHTDKNILIKQEKENKEGLFAGIDHNGSLLLQTRNRIETILAGEVFAKEEKNESKQ